MKQLEDRIKDRLEGYESKLPEGDLAEFKALLDASATAGKKRSPAYLAWFAPVAVVAGLALFFLSGHGPQQDMIHVVDGSSLVADVVEAQPEVAEMMETEPVAEAATVKTCPSTSRKIIHHDATVEVNEKSENRDSASCVSERSESENPGSNQQTGPAEQNGKPKRNNDGTSSGSSSGYSPFVPSGSSRKPVSVKVGQATAGVLGGTGALALASVIPSIMKSEDAYNGSISDDSVNPGGSLTDPDAPVDGRTGNDTHFMPLRSGFSLRIPFTERWSLTTGLDYSWYASNLDYSHSGVHRQDVHYLGIPLRADFTIARNRWMDVYVGAGGSVDFCVAAYDAGQKIEKDGVGFSIIGAGGIQFNINKNLGLFLDPTFSWNIPANNRKLDTYRSEHPFMLTLSTGLRVTIPAR
ncbi:MAG: hypothetical protein KIG56_00185 [Bacteroidales bacterium]|nr:hypothetical protein [Bacteroidales bacterium]